MNLLNDELKKLKINLYKIFIITSKKYKNYGKVE